MNDIIAAAPHRAGLPRVLALLGALLLLAASLVLVAERPAQAAHTNCPSGYSCLWRDLNCVTAGSGSNYYKIFTGVYQVGSYENSGGSANDTATGVKNAGNFDSVNWYENINSGGSYFTLAPGQYDCDLGDGVTLDSFWNNRISSGKFI
jgi:hypothetical protein